MRLFHSTLCHKTHWVWKCMFYWFTTKQLQGPQVSINHCIGKPISFCQLHALRSLFWLSSRQRQDLWSPSCQSCCRLTWTESPSSLSPLPDACRRLRAYGVWWPTLLWTMACKSRKRRWTMWSHRWLQEMPLGDWWFFVWCLGKGFFPISQILLASAVGVLLNDWLFDLQLLCRCRLVSQGLLSCLSHKFTKGPTYITGVHNDFHRCYLGFRPM